jgi:hypothetical protein
MFDLFHRLVALLARRLGRLAPHPRRDPLRGPLHRPDSVGASHTDRELLAALATFSKQGGITVSDYERWRSAHRELPAWRPVRRRMGPAGNAGETT